ncbi:hypothetical protein [Peterkaempfera griseoplana]|uniref:hypothetical protein n=1 Tax=Peterkaempfera griseoplana TaxID=66896 RepID=UPI0006E3BC4D|nr:hypothetical protein [Peterkaempfera griseoplana]
MGEPIPDSAKHPRCGDTSRRLPCMRAAGHEGAHRDALNVEWGDHAPNLVETHEPLRRLPWTGPEGKAEYVTAGPGIVNQLADSTEEHIVCMARADAKYALAMAERPAVTTDELRIALRKLAVQLRDVANVAELRRERLSEPVYGPAVRALEQALRASLGRFGRE